MRWKRRLLHHASIITSHLSAGALKHNGGMPGCHTHTPTHAHTQWSALQYNVAGGEGVISRGLHFTQMVIGDHPHYL